IHQLKPDNTAYNEIRTFRATTQLDGPSIKRALLELMRRHEILRSNVVFLDGQLQQIVHPYEEVATELALEEVDLGHMPAAEREQEAQRLVHATVKRPFDLAKGLPWRNILLRMGDTDTVFVSVIHHILCDGWGLDIFEQELQTLYMAFQSGQP